MLGDGEELARALRAESVKGYCVSVVVFSVFYSSSLLIFLVLEVTISRVGDFCI